MPTALDPSATWEYVLKSDREKIEEKSEYLTTVFILKSVPSKDLAKIKDRMARFSTPTGKSKNRNGSDDVDMTTFINAGTHNIDILRIGLVGWTNFKFKDGGEAIFRSTTEPSGLKLMDQKCVDFLSDKDQVELVEAITERNEVTAEELGNLRSPS